MILNRDKKYCIEVDKDNQEITNNFLISIGALMIDDATSANFLLRHAKITLYLEYFINRGWRMMTWYNDDAILSSVYEKININQFLRSEKLNNIL